MNMLASEQRELWRAFQARQGISPATGHPGPLTLEAVLRLEGYEPQGPVVGEFSFGGPPLRAGVDRDPSRLLPGFAARVELLFQRLRARGLDPMLWEAYRSPERAAALHARGSGSKRSLHCLGAAVDIVHREDYWSAPGSFWKAIGQEARALGLTWGGRWRRRDLPHVQAVPVWRQRGFRAMTDEQRRAKVA